MKAAETARQVSEGVRALNYATLPAGRFPGLEWPSDAYDTLGAMAEAAHRMPQATEQVAAFLRAQATRPGLVDVDILHGGRREPDTAIAAAAAELARAGTHLRQAAAALDRAQQATSGLAVDDEEAR